MANIATAAEEARQIVLEKTGFDLYESPRFATHLVCQLADLDGSEQSAQWDAVHPSGLKVKVVHAVAVLDKVFRVKTSTGTPRTSQHSYFHFRRLQRARHASPRADVYVLVGYDQEQLRFFVVPGMAIGKRRAIKLFLDAQNRNNSSRWLQYETTAQDLGAAIGTIAGDR